MNYTEKTKALFEKLSWINLSKFAEHLQMDRGNLVKYCNGKLEVTEKIYEKILQGLKDLKSEMP